MSVVIKCVSLNRIIGNPTWRFGPGTFRLRVGTGGYPTWRFGPGTFRLRVEKGDPTWRFGPGAFRLRVGAGFGRMISINVFIIGPCVLANS